MERHEAITRAYLIPGWMWPAELGWLYDTFGESKTHVEIGSFCGRSLWASCAGMERAVVWSVDSFAENADSVPDAIWLRSVADATSEAIQRQGIDLRAIRRGSIEQARELYRQGVRLDSIFLDGCHELAEVSADISEWLPLLRPGGIMAGHDYSPRNPGVMDAVNDAFPGRFQVAEATRIWHVRI
jgi:hypothetical protein